MNMLKGVCIGAGYFSKFQYEAWNRIEDVKIVALCNRTKENGEKLAKDFSIPNVYTSLVEMLDSEKPDFIDIITPPETHLTYCREAYKRKINVIVQKPLAPTLDDSRKIVEEAKLAGVRLMVHENFRFQPWYREIKKLLHNNAIGDKVHSAYFRMRMGDGWGEDAYLSRQPYFREMPRLLIYETGIHFIDTFRYLFGSVVNVSATLRRLNPIIKGEDAGVVNFQFAHGTLATWDANRYNEANVKNARYTFGEMLVEGNNGSIRLYNNGNITIQHLGDTEKIHHYNHVDINFAGDCVYTTQQHFIDCLKNEIEFETSGEDYLRNIEIQEEIYSTANSFY